MAHAKNAVIIGASGGIRVRTLTEIDGLPPGQSGQQIADDGAVIPA